MLISAGSRECGWPAAGQGGRRAIVRWIRESDAEASKNLVKGSSQTVTWQRERRAAERAAAAESPRTAFPQPLGKRCAFSTRTAAPAATRSRRMGRPGRSSAESYGVRTCAPCGRGPLRVPPM